eukprot:2139936-Rhodomonas_salina.1
MFWAKLECRLQLGQSGDTSGIVFRVLFVCWLAERGMSNVGVMVRGRVQGVGMPRVEALTFGTEGARGPRASEEDAAELHRVAWNPSGYPDARSERPLRLEARAFSLAGCNWDRASAES